MTGTLARRLARLGAGGSGAGAAALVVTLALAGVRVGLDDDDLLLLVVVSACRGTGRLAVTVVALAARLTGLLTLVTLVITALLDYNNRLLLKRRTRLGRGRDLRKSHRTGNHKSWSKTGRSWGQSTKTYRSCSIVAAVAVAGGR